MYVETFALTQESLRIQTSNSKSQPIRLEVAVSISKFLRKGFSIIKMYYSYSNFFIHFSLERTVLPIWSKLS